MTVFATQELETLDDILDTLSGIVASNTRWVRKNGGVDLYDGRFVYRLRTPDKCGADRWQRIWQGMKGSPPWYQDCDFLAPALCGILRGTGEDPNAQLRLIQIDTTAHVQVVSRGKVLDPSARLGMPVPAELRRKIYDLSFKGIP